eukprot:8729079-Lingulodinium_polyedra.AAC.1
MSRDNLLRRAVERGDAAWAGAARRVRGVMQRVAARPSVAQRCCAVHRCRVRRSRTQRGAAGRDVA